MTHGARIVSIASSRTRRASVTAAAPASAIASLRPCSTPRANPSRSARSVALA